jgi:hypothetical protein
MNPNKENWASPTEVIATPIQIMAINVICNTDGFSRPLRNEKNNIGMGVNDLIIWIYETDKKL